jgi:hypothetical protein
MEGRERVEDVGEGLRRWHGVARVGTRELGQERLRRVVGRRSRRRSRRGRRGRGTHPSRVLCNGGRRS